MKMLSRWLKGSYSMKNVSVEPKEWNVLLDAKVLSIDDHTLNEFSPVVFNETSDAFWEFLRRGMLKDFQKLDYIHKKALEFFFAYRILNPQRTDSFLDAAGGDMLFLRAIKRVVGCKVFANDHIYKEGIHSKNGIRMIGGDVTNIMLPDQSLTKITCIHSFEHFHEDKDSRFIKEIARLLKKKGEAVIIPIFISQRYYETWNKPTNQKFDPNAETLVDLSASLPGSENTGFFARVYDKDSFNRRVFEYSKKLGLHPTLYTCMLDGQHVPDMEKNVGAKINKPMRALHLKKF